jgi:hypothetical protein
VGGACEEGNVMINAWKGTGGTGKTVEVAVSQRESGYARKPGDAYQTPEWVTRALIPHLPRRPGRVWEPACGEGLMVAALGQEGLDVVASDIDVGEDFLDEMAAPDGCGAIFTNPPYVLAGQFIEHALRLMQPRLGIVAMLLRTDFDHAKTRAHLFGGCPVFARKLVLTKRIVWFEGGPSSPSFNHCWFIWDWRHSGPPTIGYGP